MKSKKIIFGVVAAIFVAGVVLVVMFGEGFSPAVPEKTLSLPERNDTVPQVPILHDYGTKIVYTTDTTINKEIYINDCSGRGGVFNVCGSPCEPTAEACVTVCALTCTTK